MKLRLSGALVALLCMAGVARAAPIYGYQVVRTYPHDVGAFTEGLFYQDGLLYESTGLEGRSSIRKERLETGEVVLKRDIPRQYFGEGVVAWGGKLIELTWKSRIGFTYDLATFQPTGHFNYRGEGWGLTEGRPAHHHERRHRPDSLPRPGDPQGDRPDHRRRRGAQDRQPERTGVRRRRDLRQRLADPI